jgi:methylglyoxal reductase
MSTDQTTSRGGYVEGVSIGRSGVEVTQFGLGTWAVGGPAHNLGLPMGWAPVSAEAALAGLRTGYELGVRYFDTADVYGLGSSEELLGRFIATVDRGDIVVSGKAGYQHHLGEHSMDPVNLRAAVTGSLRRLNLAHLDMLALHHNDFGPQQRWLEPAAEFLRELRRAGTVRAIGIRGPHRFAPTRYQDDRGATSKTDEFHSAFHAIEPDYVSMRCNLLTPRVAADEVDAYAWTRERNVAVVGYKVLGQGLLTGRYHAGFEARNFGQGDHRSRKHWFSEQGREQLRPAIEGLGRAFGESPSERIALAIQYCRQRMPGAALLLGFTTADQVRQSLTAARPALDAQELAAAEAIVRDALVGVGRYLP